MATLVRTLSKSFSLKLQLESVEVKTLIRKLSSILVLSRRVSTQKSLKELALCALCEKFIFYSLVLFTTMSEVRFSVKNLIDMTT